MKPLSSFGSDNCAGVHPEVLRAMAEANHGYVEAYGADAYTESARAQFRHHFGDDVEVFFVFNGTAANCLGLKALSSSYHAVICGAQAHIYVDECGAPEKFTGSKLIPVEAESGKLTLAAVRPACQGVGDQHHVQPRVVSITQATELGTVYKPEEVRQLADFAHGQHMLFHVDGARLANAAAHLGGSLRSLTRDLGVDVLSFGATKNGALGAEAVVFFDPDAARDFKFYRKQAMQLASKMRFVAVQFEALFKDDLWLRNARHANRMAQLLKQQLEDIPEVRVIYEVEANGVFVQIPRQAVSRLKERYSFYVWDEGLTVVRWMCSWYTTEADIGEFVEYLRQVV